MSAPQYSADVLARTPEGVELAKHYGFTFSDIPALFPIYERLIGQVNEAMRLARLLRRGLDDLEESMKYMRISLDDESRWTEPLIGNRAWEPTRPLDIQSVARQLNRVEREAWELCRGLEIVAQGFTADTLAG